MYKNTSYMTPATWKIYLFNVIDENILIKYREHFGSLIQGSSGTLNLSSYLTSYMSVKAIAYRSYSTNTYLSGNRLATQTAEFVSDDRIKFEVDVDLTGFDNVEDKLKGISATISTDNSLTTDSGSDCLVGENEVSCSGIYIQNFADDTYHTISYSLTNINTDYVKDNKMKIIYFKKVNSNYSSSYDYYYSLININLYTPELLIDSDSTTLTSFVQFFSKAIVPKPSVSKSESNNIWSVSIDNSSLISYSSINYNTSLGSYYHYFNGDFHLKDTINVLKVVDEDGNAITDASILEYIKLKSININWTNFNGSGSLSIDSTTSKNDEGYYVYENSTDATKNIYISLDYDFANGNMVDGFDLKFKDLKNNKNITLYYSFDIDYEGISKSLGENPTKTYSIEYENVVNVPHNKYYLTGSSSKKATFQVLASLATSKSIGTLGTTNYVYDTRSYTATATIGYTDVPYVDFKDFIQEFYNYDNADTVYSSAEARQAFASYIDLKNMKITALLGGESTEVIIYENGLFTENWTNSTLTYSTTHENGDLYDIHFVQNDTNIPAGTKITITYDAVLNLDEKDSNGKSFRDLDYYLGDEIYITNNVKAVIPYSTITTLSDDLPELASHFDNLISTLSLDEYENYVDTENQQLVCYGGAGAGGIYLKEREIVKSMTASTSSNITNWQIKESFNSAGKAGTIELNLNDSFYFNISNTLSSSTLNTEQKTVLKQNLQYLLEKHSSFKDLKVYYEVDGNSELLYQFDGIITSEDEMTIKSIDGVHSGKLKYTKELFNKVSDISATLKDKSLYLSFDNFDYDTIVLIKYSIYTDWEAFTLDAYESGLLNDSYNIVGTTETVKAVMQNDVVEASEYKAHSGGSSISITDQLSKINKSVLSRSNDVVSWQLTANTGTISSPITITDTMELTATDEKVINDLNKSMVFKDFVIKIDGKIAYDGTSDEPYKNGWTSDNVLLVVDDFTFTVTLKDTDTNKFIANDSDVVITYKTGIDMNKYNDLGGNMSGTYNIHNESLLEKNGIKSSATRDLNGISFEFPLSVLKSFVGNDENDLEMTNWNIVMNTGSLDRKNVSISDTSKLASDFGSYLSIKDMKIVINKTDDSKNVTSEVIYDFGEGITTLPEGVYLYKVNSEGALDGELVFGQDGIYDFVIVFDELLENTEVVVDYKLGINRVKYIENKEISDFELVNNNEVIVKAEDGSNERDSSTGSSSVVSKLTKEYQYIGLSAQDLPVYRWSVGVNLLADNSLEDLTNANVTITDILDPTLTYVENSVEIYKRVTTASGTKLSTKLSDGSYTTLIEDNKLQITILNPKDDYDLVLRFKTEVNTTVNNLTNYVTLAVNGVTTEVASESIGKLFSPTTSGTVSSNGIYTHKIHALKYLDNKLSVNTFKFKAEEVNENGELVDNGYVSIVENSSDGSIVFDQIKYKKEGTYYYKITEVSDNDKYTYDNTIYTLKVDVVLYKNNYIISSESLVGLEQGASIEFKNYTKVVEDEKIENPNTKDKIIIALLILILSFVVLFNLKNFSKLIKRYRNV